MKIGKKDDLTLEPSETLNRETLEMMAALAANAPVRQMQKRSRLRRIAACAALIGAMFMLMGAGYRVFTQMAYVPGQGIVQDTVENAYILQEAVEAGEYYIDGISVIPVTEGEHKGQWEVRVITTEPRESPETIFFAYDDSKVTLEKTAGDSRYTQYAGYIPKASAGQYTVGLAYGAYPVELSRLSQSTYVNYKYPVEQGIQAVIYPLTDGSDKLIVNFSLEYLSEDLRYWAQHSQNIHVSLDWDDFLLTDTEGNTYRMSKGTTSGIRIPLTEEKKSLYPYLRYDSEAIYFLDRRLEAPIAEIEFGIVRLSFSQIRNTEQYTLTIPAEGETVTMPEDTILLDSHGIRDTLLRIESGAYTHFIDEYHAFTVFREPLTCTFPENITRISLTYDFIIKIDPQKVRYMYLTSGPAVEGYAEPPVNWQELPYEMHTVYPLKGDGTKTVRQKTPGIGYGDTVILIPAFMQIDIQGSWHIDFTAPAPTLPKEIVRYPKN
ncbi:MAG: hypothetical protein IJX14_12530 [Clostridia bacterium]|nr:hypothetical protein [Clostridia bacterium]